MKDGIIAAKSIEFFLKIIKLYKYLCDEKREFVMSKQILRSGTSIGANIAESQYAQSSADFINKLSISLKEASETEYWLILLETSEYANDSQLKELKTDCVSLIKMLTSSINTMKSKLENK